MKFTKYLSQIAENNRHINKHEIKQILLIDFWEETFIGDFILRIRPLCGLKYQFKNAKVDFCAPTKEKYDVVKHLIKNNPYINKYYYSELEDICIQKYDLIILATRRKESERWLFNYLFENRLKQTSEKIIYSICVNPEHTNPKINEDIDEIKDYNVDLNRIPEELYNKSIAGEIYLSKEEIRWGEDWLKEMGVKDNESLLVIIDSASEDYKLLDSDTYTEILNWFLKFNLKILFFDEKKFGKKEKYKNQLGIKKSKKIIVAESCNLRELLCILSSDKIKLMFGPSTGPMHCASAIQNVSVLNGKLREDIPLMFVYLGRNTPAVNEYYYWGGSLATAFSIRYSGNGKFIKRLVGVGSIGEFNENLLDCSDSNSGMLIDFLNKEIAISDNSNSVLFSK